MSTKVGGEEKWRKDLIDFFFWQQFQFIRRQSKEKGHLTIFEVFDSDKQLVATEK